MIRMFVIIVIVSTFFLLVSQSENEVHTETTQESPLPIPESPLPTPTAPPETRRVYASGGQTA